MNRLIAFFGFFALALSSSFAAGDIWGAGSVPAIESAEDVPRSLEQLWSGYEEDYDRRNPLETEILKTWEEDGIVYNVVRFTVGVFRGEKAKLAGFYAYPKGGEDLPAIVQTNGGGQRASLYGPRKWAQRGYACFNPNNGAQPWGQEAKGLPNTDWGALRPGLPGDKRDGKGWLAPGPYTIDAVVSPRNEQWFPRVIGARRAITFLQSRPEVDPGRIGIRGHSTGGVMTVSEMVDPRVKAAVPSVGGCGFWLDDWKYVMGNTRGDKGADEEQEKLYRNTVASEASWKRMDKPVFFLGASNDFNSPTDNCWKALEAVPKPDNDIGWALAPQRNHSFTPAAAASPLLWFEDHLKGEFDFPAMPKAALDLDSTNHVPRLSVQPDPSSALEILEVEVYYSYGRIPMQRFWNYVEPIQDGGRWVAECPVFELSEPLFAFANVIYKNEHEVEGPGAGDYPRFLVTSSFCTASPPDMKAAGVRATAERRRLLEDFDGPLKEWSGRLDTGNLSHWNLLTRKIQDARYLAPQGAELVFEIKGPAGSMLGLKATRRNRSHNGGTAFYYAFLELPNSGWNTIRVEPADFQNAVGEKLDTWRMAETLELMDAQQAVNDKKKFLKRVGDRAVPALPTSVSQWNSSYYQSTDDSYAKDNVSDSDTLDARGFLRNMRWIY